MSDRTPGSADAAEPTFEASMERLEAIVRQLEKGEIGLEASLALFEEGVGLARRLEQRLGDAEMTVETLLRAPGGEERVAPLDVPDDDAP